jgi:hypothetical protein
MKLAKEELDSRINALLAEEVSHAERVLAAYNAAPSCCRMVNDSLIRRTVRQASPAELGMVESPRYVWRCPTCKRCVLDKS